LLLYRRINLSGSVMSIINPQYLSAAGFFVPFKRI